MSREDVIGNRLEFLREIVRNGINKAPAQVQGFVTRALERENRYVTTAPLYQERTIEDCLEALRFDGYPALARAGYSLARCDGSIDTDVIDRFMQCIEQQRDRPASRRAEIAGDSLVLLGIADGLRATAQRGQPDQQRLEAARTWTRELLEQHGGSDVRLGRARLLASDLLDDQGRFGRHIMQSNDVRVAALDLCLWRGWPDILRNLEPPETAQQQELLKALLFTQPPDEGEPLHAAIWLCAFDVLTDDIAATVVPDVHHVVRLLTQTQGSFRRWRWEEKAMRQKTMPARWLIDKEADVQAFLFAVLYPYFKDQLEDEQYLQGFGLRQGRFDFAVSSLGLIVEVKVIRTFGDINRIESEIADDLALYFKEDNPFRTMIVYIYDDSDRPEPEKYPAIRDALTRRSERIVDVIVVQRPSMIPNRIDRQQ